MDKKTGFRIRLWWTTGLLLLVLVIQTSGCANALLAPIYLIKGTDVDPMFKKEMKEIPKESKAIVVCRSSVNLFGSENPNRDLSQALTLLFTKKLEKKKMVWIPYDKTEEFYDDHSLSLDTYQRIGSKVGADYVFGIDLDSFNTQLSSQFYQGRAKAHVQLVEVKTGKVIARQTLPEYVYPPTPTPKNDKHESEFQKQFTVKLACQIGNLFYPYNPHDKFAVDSDFPER
ncbi:MAG: hypothetical protein PHQ75_03475 [Thermoguttaceae bacterium]|nr:hypothetical protein [Thermoguttaceae bacterium]